MNANTSSDKKRLRLALTASFLLLLGIAAALGFLLAPPALASTRATPTATRQAWAMVDLPKPTYTPTPTATFTSTPTFTPTVTSSPTPPPTATPTFTAIPTKTPIPPPTQPPPQTHGQKRILIDISEQHLYAYEGNTLVYSFVASTGMNNATRVGHFSVLNKIPNAYGSTWDIWMPNWLGIYWSGNLQNGIHALPIMSNGQTLWAGYLGTPISYGCIVLGTYESKLLYDWAEIGTPVDIQP